MEWHDVLKKKKQVVFFDQTRVPDKRMIEMLIKEMHTYTPSKQNDIPYFVIANGPEQQDRINFLYKNAYCDHREDKGNSQVLAPYVIEFHPVSTMSTAEIEIGMAAMMLGYCAVNAGLDIAYCGTFHPEDETQIDPTGKTVAAPSPLLALCLGYNSEPHAKKDEKSTDEGFPTINKRSMDKYVTWFDSDAFAKKDRYQLLQNKKTDDKFREKSAKIRAIKMDMRKKVTKSI